MSSSSDEIGKLFFWKKKGESVLSNMVNLTQIDVWLSDKWVDFFFFFAKAEINIEIPKQI